MLGGFWLILFVYEYIDSYEKIGVFNNFRRFFNVLIFFIMFLNINIFCMSYSLFLLFIEILNCIEMKYFYFFRYILAILLILSYIQIKK